MPTSFIQNSTESHFNKISTYRSLYNNTNENNGFIKKISAIANNNISLKKIGFISFPLRTMNIFFQKIKSLLLIQKLTQAPVDIELDRILSQGKIFSDEENVFHSLINDKSNIPPASLSLTTKTGMVLGGLLLTSVIGVSGTYYSQRTGREHRHDIPLNTTNSDELASISLAPYNFTHLFSAKTSIELYPKLSEKRDTFFSSRKKYGMTKSAKSNRRFLNINKAYPCPPIEGKQKTKILTSVYIYTTKQSAICLTESFNEKCQNGHRHKIINKGCHYTPQNMILKIKGRYCMCPPPDWLDIKLVTPEKVNKSLPCPPIDEKKERNAFIRVYFYTIKQPAICLTDSFNKSCQKGHRERVTKKNCHDTPDHMTLKIRDIYCLCPPPDWLETEVIEPSPSDIKKINQQKNITPTIIPMITIPSTRLKPKSTNITLPIILPDNDEMIKKTTADPLNVIEPLASAIKAINQDKDILSTFIPMTTTHSTILAPKSTNITLPIVLPDNDETIKNRTVDPYERHLAPKTNHTLTLLSDTKKQEEIDKVSTLTCYNERENMTKSKITRIISNSIFRPFSTLINEGRVIIQYSYLEQGCVNNTEFIQATEKVEAVIETVLSFVPGYNRLRFATKFVAGLLELYSDVVEEKPANTDTINDLHSQLISLAKDAISSLLTRDIERISKSTNKEEIKDITKPLEYQNDNLMITDHNGKKIKTQRELNHLYDPDSNGFIFYDHQKKWFVDNNVESNHYIRETFQKAMEVWKDTENISFYKNSTPEYYGNNIIIKHNNDIYALINNDFYPIDEIPLTDTIFRYFINKNTELPMTRGENGWVLEDQNSYSSSLKLQSFIKNNMAMKNTLISDHISHRDVTPLTLDGDIQFDKNLNQYLKINGEYFLIKKYQDASYYIEGSHSTLALQMIDNEYHIKESFFDGLCCFHKESLSMLPGVNQEGNFFLDNTVTSHIKSIKFSSNSKNIMTQEDVIEVDFTPSPHIEGAISNSGYDYLYYDNMFIHIHSNEDGTYILGDINDNKNNIIIYKNTESKVYFKIPKSRTKWQGLKERNGHCIVKRQPLSICTAPYFETGVVNYLLNHYSHEGIIIHNHAEQLEPYHGFRGIYKTRRGDSENLYYHTGINDIFLYARKASDTSSHIVPIVFTIYGKNTREQINLNHIILNVSMIKDFDTKKIIICTPEEAHEYIFNIKRKEFTLHLEWQGTDQIHPEVTDWDLEIIQHRTPLINDLSSLDELFDRSGKKIITSPENIDRHVAASINSLLHPSANLINSLKINSLKDIMDSNVPFVIKDICNQAFEKTITNINDAITTMKNLRESVNNYLTHTLKISDPGARNKFYINLEKQLDRMKMIFDENNKEHIMIISKIRQSNINTEVLSKKGKTTLGFNLSHDPLDRIYINTAMINDFSENDRLFNINMISDTMLHEAVHALGMTEDYVYLPTNRDGHISEISTSTAEIEDSIAWGYTESINLEYLSRLYFLKHPLYNKYSITSLVKASNLLNIFRNDPYYRSIILINNPDTISVIIRELAQFSPDQ